MQLPIFPASTTLINTSVGFFEKDDFVYYLHNGSPIYCHDKNDLSSYRHFAANLVITKLCAPNEVVRARGVSSRNIQRCDKVMSRSTRKVEKMSLISNAFDLIIFVAKSRKD
jgi:hypothetical protein